jgi:hypothetical protein
MRLVDLTGQKFHRLTVLRMLEWRQHKAVLWQCRCDCGQECRVLGPNLKRGLQKSCGCLRDENRLRIPKKMPIDLAGKRFGRLLVLRLDVTPRRSRGAHWLCACDCGKAPIVAAISLRQKITKSCGCLNKDRIGISDPDDDVVAYRRNRAAMQRAKMAGAFAEMVDVMAVLERDGWRCYLCGVDTPRSLRGCNDNRAPELDHVHPIHLGGSHTYTNTACICRLCNKRRRYYT